MTLQPRKLFVITIALKLMILKDSNLCCSLHLQHFLTTISKALSRKFQKNFLTNILSSLQLSSAHQDTA